MFVHQIAGTVFSAEQAQACSAEICHMMACDFERIAKKEKGVSAISLIQQGLRLISFHPHLQQPSRAFVTDGSGVALNWLLTAATGYSGKLPITVAEFVIAIILELDFSTAEWQSDEEERVAKIAVNYAKSVQERTLAELSSIVPDWGMDMVKALQDNPHGIFEVHQ